MTDVRRQYYEQASFWVYDYRSDPVERERIERTIESIPDEVNSLLDAGCGNGNLVNSLLDDSSHKIDRIVGIDWSEEALKHVRSEKRQGVITELPFESNSFDLVAALEVIEHLPEGDFAKALAELQRVSRRYIMITVPNDDHLERSLVICARCRCRFNPHFHMQSFTKELMPGLLGNSECIHVAEIGPLLRQPAIGRFGYAVLRTLRPPTPPSTAICPQCGHKHSDGSASGAEEPRPYSQSSGIVGVVKRLTPSVKKRRWLHALYRVSA